MNTMNERLVSGYATFATPEDLVNSDASAPAISPTWSVSLLSVGSFATGFSVAATVDRGC